MAAFHISYRAFSAAIAAILICLLFAQGTAQTFDAAALDSVIKAELEQAGTPGAAVAVIKDGRVLFSRGYGTTSSESGVPITEATLFRMGSTTKMFTAAAALAAASGKMRADEPVGRRVKGIDPAIAKLTLHQLLSQSSGLRDFAPIKDGHDDAVLGENIRLWRQDAFFTEPETIYSYSSANYWLAGLAIEELTGRAYADAVAELILRPLGMQRSTIRSFEAMTYPMALGHTIEGGKAKVVRPIDNNAAKYPGGSLYSSIEELSRFAIAMLDAGRVDGKQAIPAEIVAELKKPQFILPGGDAFYGYGLLGYEVRGVPTVSHGGVSRGYGSTIFFAPEQRAAVIVLANSNGQTLPKTRMAAIEMLIRESAVSEARKPQGISTPLASFVGRYEHAPQAWEFSEKGGKLIVNTDGKEFELERAGDTEFNYERGPIVFVKNGAGKYEHIFMGLYAARRVK